jgi:hypothetical protein
MPPVVDSIHIAFETAPCDALVDLERRCTASVPDVHQNAPPPRIETARWSIGPGKLKGQFGYDFIAEGRGAFDGLKVLWGPPRDEPDGSRARRFKLLIGSEPLWRQHANGGNAKTTVTDKLQLLEGDLWRRAPALDQVEVRRIDVAIDHWGYRWSLDDLKRFACRARVRAANVERETPPDSVRPFYGPTSATYYVGKRSGAGRMLRVYDKVAEAAHSGKLPWMQPIWKQYGWDGAATVWRAEVEHGGEWLTNHGMDSAAKLDGCERALWRDYARVTRHTTGTATRAKRSPTSRVWTCIRGAIRRAERGAGNAQPAWTWEPEPPRPAGDMKQLTSMAAGCMRRIRDAMFAGQSDRPELWTFMRDALDQAEARARERQAQLARGGRAPPAARAEPTPPPPAAASPPPATAPPPRPPRRARIAAAPSETEDAFAG